MRTAICYVLLTWFLCRNRCIRAQVVILALPQPAPVALFCPIRACRLKAINVLGFKHADTALVLFLALSLRAERLDWYFRMSAGYDFERALTRARVHQHKRKHSLFGFSVSAKELLLLKNGFAEASSMMLSGLASAHDSEALTRLKRAGASMLCRANMDELGIGSDGSACAHGFIVNA